MASIAISTLAGTVLAELPLDDTLRDLVVGDLLERLPPPDCAGGVPRLLLGPRELGWSERLAELALAPGAVVTLVLVSDPEQAAADLLGTECTPIRLAAARALGAMGAAAAGQAGKLADAVLSDPDAEVAGEGLKALQAMGEAVEPGSDFFRDVKKFGQVAQLAWDLEDPAELYVDLRPATVSRLIGTLEALLAHCDASLGQAALRRWTVLRRLAPLDEELASGHGEPLLADPLDDPRPEVRLAAVAMLASGWTDARLSIDYIGEERERFEDIKEAASKLVGVLQSHACLDVRRRAAVSLARAPHWLPVVHLCIANARAALAAEVEALGNSALPADHCRMEAVQSILQLLNQHAEYAKSRRRFR